MDAFWLIPLGVLGIVFLVILYSAITRGKMASPPPHVIVDKPPTEPAVDPAAKSMDWTHKPCGSFMEWLRK